MPGTPTTKYAIPTLAGATLARDIDTEVNAGLSAIDSKMVGYSEGPLSSRPTSSGGTPGVKGRIYKATDTGRLYIDNGTGWDEVTLERAGYNEVLTSQAYAGGATVGDLASVGPSVTITVPTNGLVAVFAQADINGSGGGINGFVHLTEDGVDLGEILDLAVTTSTTAYTAPGTTGNGTTAKADGGWLVFSAAAGSRLYRLRYHGNATYANRKLWARAVAF